jgi:hypothetical protein
MRPTTLAMVALAGLALAACSKPKPKEYDYPAWNFGASFEGAPKVTDTPASKDGTSPHNLLVESNVGGHDFSVNVTDASSASTTPDEMLNATPDALAKGMGIDVGATTYAATGTVMGREVRFDKEGKPVMLMRVFVAGNYLYEISANSTKGVTDPASKAFLTSFHLITPPPPPTSGFDPGGASVAAPTTNAATNAAP